MKTPKLKLGLRHRSAAAKLKVVGNFVSYMRKQPEAVQKSLYVEPLEQLRKSVIADQNEMRQLKTALSAVTHRLRVNLKQMEAAGQRSAIALAARLPSAAEVLAAGLELERAKSPVGPPGAPTVLRALKSKTLRTGEVDLMWKRPVRRCVHFIEMTIDPNGNEGWQAVGNAEAARYVISGLVPGRQYWFRIRAHNAHGYGPWVSLQVAATA